MMRCRACHENMNYLFVSLGSSPLANVYPTQNQLHHEEHFYPLDVYLCEHCFLVQLPEFESPETIFDGYVYFSSYSDSWLNHAREYVSKMIDRFGIGKEHFVVEIGSNDGYLLQFFAKQGIPVLGIEPALTVAKAAQEKGIPTQTTFFGRPCAEQLSREGKKADLLLGNNVLAHVPDLNGFVEGLRILLAPNGVCGILGARNGDGHMPFLEMIVGNQTVFGSVNAYPGAFGAAVDDLARFDAKVLDAMLTRLSWRDYGAVLRPPVGAIKVVHTLGDNLH